MQVNEDFLKNDRSAKFWWWLGVMFGDGCVSANGGSFRTTLAGHTKETDLVEKWLDLICMDTVVKPCSENGIVANISSFPLGKFLVSEWNLLGKKTLNTRYPAGRVPKDMLNHFARGLMDADGYIKIQTCRDWSPRLIVTFSSSIPDFCKQLQAEIVACGVPGGCLHESETVLKATGKKYWRCQIKWTGETALQVCRWLYKDSTPEIQSNKGPDAWKEAEENEIRLKAPCSKCGSTKRKMKGVCSTCFWKAQAANRPDCSSIRGAVKCARPAAIKGLCDTCYAREQYHVRKKHGTGGAEQLHSMQSDS